jgi:hypothetical protein
VGRAGLSVPIAPVVVPVFVAILAVTTVMVSVAIPLTIIPIMDSLWFCDDVSGCWGDGNVSRYGTIQSWHHQRADHNQRHSELSHGVVSFLAQSRRRMAPLQWL